MADERKLNEQPSINKDYYYYYYYYTVYTYLYKSFIYKSKSFSATIR